VCFIFVHAEFVRIKLMMMMISGLSANIASKKWVSLSPGNVNNLYVCEPDRLRKKKKLVLCHFSVLIGAIVSSVSLTWSLMLKYDIRVPEKVEVKASANFISNCDYSSDLS